MSEMKPPQGFSMDQYYPDFRIDFACDEEGFHLRCPSGNKEKPYFYFSVPVHEAEGLLLLAQEAIAEHREKNLSEGMKR